MKRKWTKHRIKQLQRKLGLKNADMADRLGVKLGTYHNYIYNGYNPCEEVRSVLDKIGAQINGHFRTRCH